MNDGHSFVYTSENGLGLLRIPSGESIELVKEFVLEPRGSYDGRWILFQSASTNTIRQVFVAPSGKGSCPERNGSRSWGRLG